MENKMAELTRIEKLYLKYAELKNEAEQDCLFNKADVMQTGFNHSQLLIKWINKKSEYTKLFRSIEEKRKKSYRDLFEFYKNDYPIKLSTKEEYTLFIESDKNYVEHLNISLTVKEIIQFIDATMDIIRQKGYDVKNYIEWSKFVNGVN